MNQVCCCSSPDCLQNGCILTRKQKEYDIDSVRMPMIPVAPVAPVPQPKQGVTVEQKTLTEEDVRRIIREELQRFTDRFIR